jgi:HEPN domain-containing protein
LSSELLVANLLRVAKEDLDGARLLGTANNRNAVYLCEQAAEKIIRAVLTTEGKHAGIKHLLNEMVDLVPDESPLKPDLRSIEHLAAYATAYRYPRRWPNQADASCLRLQHRPAKSRGGAVASRLTVRRRPREARYAGHQRATG